MIKLIQYFLIFLAISSYSQEIISLDYNWKGIYIAGDNSIDNFDRARLDLAQYLSENGSCYEEDQHLSVSQKHINACNAKALTPRNLYKSFENLNIDPRIDGCIVYMSSHGIKNYGLFVRDQGWIAPQGLETYLTQFCQNAPTIILVSACFSGQFTTRFLQKDNRIILTASSEDRPSFGCSPEEKYTYWDSCLIDQLKTSHTWRELHVKIKSCVNEKEKLLNAKPSLPQAFFGDKVKNLRIIYK